MSALLRVILKPGRSKPFWVGHPWVFSGAIQKVQGDVGDFGGPCLVEDERGQVVGSGYYNPHGLIAVRILEHRRSSDLPFAPRDLAELIPARIQAAAARRQALGLPSGQTNSYRLVNGEGDDLPGLIVDRLDSVAVVQPTTRAMVTRQEEIIGVIAGLEGIRTVVVAVSDDASRMEAIPVVREVVHGELDQPVTILEAGVRLTVDVLGGQKTGFFADQRANRVRFAALCEGASVLDLYCYVGGFGIHAARAGASNVTAVDGSTAACALARSNGEANGVSDRMEVLCGDGINFLKEARGQGRTWDRIVCDPPKFARGRKHVDEAIKKYARLNTLAMAALAPGGLLLTCSCSQHVPDPAFLRMLTDAGHRLRRPVHVHGIWGQGVDHPFGAVAPEGRYLTAVLLST